MNERIMKIVFSDGATGVLNYYDEDLWYHLKYIDDMLRSTDYSSTDIVRIETSEKTITEPDWERVRKLNGYKPLVKKVKQDYKIIVDKRHVTIHLSSGNTKSATIEIEEGQSIRDAVDEYIKSNGIEVVKVEVF